MDEGMRKISAEQRTKIITLLPELFNYTKWGSLIPKSGGEWDFLVAELNILTGPRKNVKQWRKTVTDLRTQIKEKLKKIDRGTLKRSQMSDEDNQLATFYRLVGPQRVDSEKLNLAQKRRFIELVDENFCTDENERLHLRPGATRDWPAIAEELNTLGPRKNVVQWKKCWSDLKCDVKRRQRGRLTHEEEQIAIFYGYPTPDDGLSDEQRRHLQAIVESGNDSITTNHQAEAVTEMQRISGEVDQLGATRNEGEWKELCLEQQESNLEDETIAYEVMSVTSECVAMKQEEEENVGEEARVVEVIEERAVEYSDDGEEFLDYCEELGSEDDETARTEPMPLEENEKPTARELSPEHQQQTEVKVVSLQEDEGSQQILSELFSRSVEAQNTTNELLGKLLAAQQETREIQSEILRFLKGSSFFIVPSQGNK